jgi:hypothetical protein
MTMPRELIEPKGDKRFVRRGKRGRFKETDDVGRSLATDRRKKAKKVAKKGDGDKGDRRLGRRSGKPRASLAESTAFGSRLQPSPAATSLEHWN